MIRSILFVASLFLVVVALPIGAATKEPSPSAMPAMREIVLVRHGNYVDDPTIDEKIGPHLSPIGVAQARLTAARLHGELSRLDALYVSPMQRARDTAAVIGAEFPGRTFDVVDDLAECTPPTRRVEIMAKEKPQDAAACKARLDRVFAKYFRPAQGAASTELFVCHGNVIRYLVTRALGVDTAAWLEMSVGNASITRIRVEPDGRFKVIAVGDVGHIPANLRTGASGDAERSLTVPPLDMTPAKPAPKQGRPEQPSGRHARKHGNPPETAMWITGLGVLETCGKPGLKRIPPS